jgi:hypothetical protein
MSDRGEVAKEVLRYIRCGMNDCSVRDKFGPAYEGLQQLFHELADAGFMGDGVRECVGQTKRRVNAKKLSADVVAGATPAELMTKYGLSERGLQKALRKLSGTQSIIPDQLRPDLLALYNSEAPTHAPRAPRYSIDFELPVWEERVPQEKGLVLDITEGGIGILGLAASMGEVKTLVMFSEEFLEIDPISVEAVCRWAKREGESGHWVCGFQIVGIQDKDLQDLRKVIELLML